MTGGVARKVARLAPEERISEILAAARAELTQKGYENFLPAGVAARCGVSEGTIYRYFPDPTRIAVPGSRGLVRRDSRRSNPRSRDATTPMTSCGI